ncbi:hypothetical protein BT96DRAFT_950207 [Gymnopus androsaceus JB14]|uniref:Uncharacterized protein n=1 Tax=Gymnopus androsaceus JB14 TaxID=1447944 RepID=A0A6A4GHI9_9AGAR|nr:hypothetical protein BT96DRAFT_950207 [Gymnopus androsaceus JB14]
MTKISKKLEIHNSLTREFFLILMGIPLIDSWTVGKTHRPEIVGGKLVVNYDGFLKLTEQAQNVYNIHKQASFLFERGRARMVTTLFYASQGITIEMGKDITVFALQWLTMFRTMDPSLQSFNHHLAPLRSHYKEPSSYDIGSRVERDV